MTGQDVYADRLSGHTKSIGRFHAVFGRRLTHVALFSAFLDESASHNHDEKRVYTMAGFIAPVDHWIGFDPRWSQIIDPLGVSHFHMSEYERAEKAPDGPYARDLELSKSVFNSLIDLMREYTDPMAQRIWPFAMTLDLRTWDNLPTNILEVLVDPYHALMRAVTQFVTARCQSTDGMPTQVEFVFETAPTDELTGICTNAFNKVREHEPWGKDLLNIEYAPKGRYRGNEAADIIAYEVRKHVRHLIETGQPLNTKSEPWRYTMKRFLAGKREITHRISDLSDATLRYA